MLTERRLHIPGRPCLAVLEGACQGQTVVFLHGLARRGSDWNPLIASLGGSIHPLLLDWRGHGHSDRAGRYQVRDYAEDLLALLPLLAHHPVVLMGHSLGALVAIEVASRAPERVAALVLEDPPTPGFLHQVDATGYGQIFRAYQQLGGSTEPVARLASRLASLEILDPAGKLRLLGQMRDAPSLRFMAACLKRIDPNIALAALNPDWLEGIHLGPALRQVLCPVLLLRGDPAFGGMMPPGETDLLFGPVADLTRLDLVGVGHQIHGAATESTLRALWSFLGSLEG